MKIAEMHDVFLESTGVSIDTRTIKENNIFFALSGENFNANLFAKDALAKGASLVIVDDKKFYDSKNKAYVLVSSVLTTLQELANFHRNYIGLPVISLTGSNGKTTTKNLIRDVLSRKYNVLATKGNLNNHIGVPLTLLSLEEEHDLAVVELGANHPKEIEALCKIAEPNFGYITNFGKAHLEGFGSEEGVVKAKSELYTYLKNNGGLAFVNALEAKQLELTEAMDREVFYIGEDAEFELLKAQPKLVIRYDKEQIETNLVGAYNLTNCVAALFIGAYFGISIEESASAVAAYIPDNNRSEVKKTDSNLLLMDAYNANPTSILAALNSFLSDKEHKDKVVILGDMFELGAYAEQEHQAIADYLGEIKGLKAFLLGENFAKTTIAKESDIKVYASLSEMQVHLQKNKIEGAYILLKGSRGMALENLVEYL